MDLLLFLVRKHKMNPLELKISEITDEFVEYVNSMEEVDIDATSDFVLMASTLMKIKSKLLLEPSPSAVEKQNSIARRLYEYALVKDAAKELEELYQRHSNEYVVSVLPLRSEEKKAEKIPSVFWEVLKSVEEEIKLRNKVYKISKESYSVSKKLEEIKDFISKKRKTKIRDVLLKARDRLEAVVIFVAMLELLRIKFISLDISKREVFMYESKAKG
ncbi:segregation and condensation protein A [Mesoaciditoga lauensis]|uniref:segregation and condensation protein A n=1 Tax=Mesoaciditoga lauensis TaxID=1495039 RepID=UPI0005634901|nr:segregation/condensation protein A [Mesoaciditoga lauensis]